MARIDWSDLSRTELRQLLPLSLVVLPTAATEQHGYHLATGHDAFTVLEIANRAAEITGEHLTVIVAPVLAFGSSDHHLPFGGTLSLKSETYLLVVKDLLRSMMVCGAERVLVLNGHGGNQELNEIAVRDVALEHPGMLLAAASYWNIAAPRYSEIPELEGVRVPGHAGQFETAMMMALDQEHVRGDIPERSADPSARLSVHGVRIEGQKPWPEFHGYTDFPHRATSAAGETLLQLATKEVARAMVNLGGADSTRRHSRHQNE
jgi:creatinine amidohydrolase